MQEKPPLVVFPPPPPQWGMWRVPLVPQTLSQKLGVSAIRRRRAPLWLRRPREQRGRRGLTGRSCGRCRHKTRARAAAACASPERGVAESR